VKERHPVIADHANDLALEQRAYSGTALEHIVIKPHLPAVGGGWGHVSGGLLGVLHGYRLQQLVILLGGYDARHPAPSKLGAQVVAVRRHSADGGQWAMI
jgi:hypothetical protein